MPLGQLVKRVEERLVHRAAVLAQYLPVDRDIAYPTVEPLPVVRRALPDVATPATLDERFSLEDEPVDLDVGVDDDMEVGRANRVGGPRRLPVGLLRAHIAHRPLEPVPGRARLSLQHIEFDHGSG
jgi:hypothetical protein